jgi:hypothetical protein
VIDLREEQEQNASDSPRAHLEFVSNEIDESDLQHAKHSDWASCTLCGQI